MFPDEVSGNDANPVLLCTPSDATIVTRGEKLTTPSDSFERGTEHVFGWLDPDMAFAFKKNYMCYLDHSFLAHHDTVDWICKSATPALLQQETKCGVPFVPVAQIATEVHVFPTRGSVDDLTIGPTE